MGGIIVGGATAVLAIAGDQVEKIFEFLIANAMSNVICREGVHHTPLKKRSASG